MGNHDGEVQGRRTAIAGDAARGDLDRTVASLPGSPTTSARRPRRRNQTTGGLDPGAMTPIAYRELWTSVSSSVTVRVHMDGSRTLDGQPEILPDDVRTVLSEEGYAFSRMVPNTANT